MEKLIKEKLELANLTIRLGHEKLDIEIITKNV